MHRHWYEFAPVDIGTEISGDEIKQNLRDVFKRYGWEDAQTLYDPVEYNAVIPHVSFLMQKENILLYVPQSGYAVMRYEANWEDYLDFVEEDSTYLSNDVWATRCLLARIRFHHSVEANGLPSREPEIRLLIDEVRNVCKRHSPKTFRVLNPAEYHPYSLSSFLFNDADVLKGEKFIWALQNPRKVGCSPSDPASRSVTEKEILDKIEGSLVDFENPVYARNCKAVVWSSWSTLVAGQEPGVDVFGLLTMLEFRLQSTWIAAHSVNQLARHSLVSDRKRAGKSLKPATRVLLLSVAKQTLDRVQTIHRARLGANAPEDPSRLAEALDATSDVLSECDIAYSLMESSLARAQYEVANRESASRKLLELFSLIFAASGLAAVLLPLPITLENLDGYWPQFVTWMVVSLIGIVIVLRNRS